MVTETSKIGESDFTKSVTVSSSDQQRDQPSAQQRLSTARRRLLLDRTIQKFESHFQYPLWGSEQEYLAELLKVEKPEKYKSYIQDAFSISQRAESPSKELRSKRRVSESDMKLGEENNTQQRSEPADNESSEVEEEETEIALDWLRAEWESIIKILNQTEPDGEWVVAY